MKKLDKFYQSEDRYLLIVLLGKKNSDTIKGLKTMLQVMRDSNIGNKHLENVEILTSGEYKEFLGFDAQYGQIFDKYDEFAQNVFYSNSNWDRILEMSRLAKIDLDRYSNFGWLSI